MRWAISTGTESRNSSAWPRFFPTRYEIPTILNFLDIRKWYCSDSKSTVVKHSKAAFTFGLMVVGHSGVDKPLEHRAKCGALIVHTGDAWPVRLEAPRAKRGEQRGKEKVWGEEERNKNEFEKDMEFGHAFAPFKSDVDSSSLLVSPVGIRADFLIPVSEKNICTKEEMCYVQRLMP